MKMQHSSTIIKEVMQEMFRCSVVRVLNHLWKGFNCILFDLLIAKSPTYNFDKTSDKVKESAKVMLAVVLRL